MERTEHGSIILDLEEAEVVRAALFTIELHEERVGSDGGPGCLGVRRGEVCRSGEVARRDRDRRP
jgi:hypothetical protein